MTAQPAHADGAGLVDVQLQLVGRHLLHQTMFHIAYAAADGEHTQRAGTFRTQGGLFAQAGGQPLGVLALVLPPEGGQIVPVLEAPEQLFIEGGVKLGFRQMEKRNVRE